jgi:hypothetical protein
MSSACKQLFANILHFAFDEALRPSIADDPRYTANPCTNPIVFYRKKHGSVKSCTVPFPSQVRGSRAFLALECCRGAPSASKCFKIIGTSGIPEPWVHVAAVHQQLPNNLKSVGASCNPATGSMLPQCASRFQIA